jgi:hypothetical protein
MILGQEILDFIQGIERLERFKNRRRDRALGANLLDRENLTLSEDVGVRRDESLNLIIRRRRDGPGELLLQRLRQEAFQGPLLLLGLTMA